MRERGDSTPEGEGAPAGKGEWVSIFVRDDHPLLQLKQALDWAALTAGMVTHWRAAAKMWMAGQGCPGPCSCMSPYWS